MFGKRKEAHTAGSYYAGLDYEQAMRKYADMITRICIMRCGNNEDAKDCFQNVFIKLYTAEKHFETEEYLKAWLIQVAIHQCTDYHRQAWNRKVALEDDITKLDIHSGKSDEYEEESELLLMVKKLPDKYKDVLYLYYYEGYSTAEIAQYLRCPQPTVRTRLARARKQLKSMLGGDLE